MSQDYNEAIQAPARNFSDPDLRRGEAAVNALGLPMPCSGNFADVYQVRCPDGLRWAVKCFTREAPGLRERYQEIGRHLRRAKLPFIVDFGYLEQGIRVAGRWYPVLKMEWVEGLTLNQFVAQSVDKPDTLEALLQVWRRMARYLRAAEVAHCDLQHGNVLLVPGASASSLALKLVDYDGMFVPALTGRPSGEVGHASYQHPRRLRDGTYGIDVDRFPLLLIATALTALKAGGRALWEKYDDGDNLLFRQQDLEAPMRSMLFYELLKLDDPATRPLAEALIEAARKPLDQTPLLEGLIPYERPPSNATQTVAVPGLAGADAAPAPPDEAEDASEPAQGGWMNQRARLLLISGLAVVVPALLAVGLVLAFSRNAPVPEKGSLIAKNPPGETATATPPSQTAALPASNRQPQPQPRPDAESEPIAGPGLAPAQTIQPNPVPSPGPQGAGGAGSNVATPGGSESPEKPPELMGEVRRFVGHTGEIRRLTVSPDGRQLLTAAWDKTIRLWDVATGRELLQWNADNQRVHSVAFLPDGRRALSCGNDDRLLRLWGLTDARELRSYVGHTKGLEHVAVCADGRLAVSCAYESTVIVWEIKAGKELRRLVGRKGIVETVAISNDGRLVLTGTRQGAVSLWDVEKGVERSRLEGHAGIVMGLAFSPDARFAISCGADSTVRLWDLDKAKEARRFAGHTLGVNAATFSPDGGRILTASGDETVRLWDTAAGKELYRFQGHKQHVWTVAFSPDDRYAYSAGQDAVVRMWRLPPVGEAKPEARRR
jgi:hypothetical protein